MNLPYLEIVLVRAWAEMTGLALCVLLGSLSFMLLKRWWVEGDSCQFFRGAAALSWLLSIIPMIITISIRLVQGDSTVTRLSPYLAIVFPISFGFLGGILRCEALRKRQIVPAIAIEVIKTECGVEVAERVRDRLRAMGIRVLSTIDPDTQAEAEGRR